MALEKGFLLLVGGSTEERDLGEAKPPDKELHGEGTAVHYHLGFAEVDLSILSRIVSQWDKNQAWLGAVLVDIFPDSGFAAGVALLLFEPVVYAAGGMMLFGRPQSVFGQPLIYEFNKRPEYRPGTRTA